MTPVRVILFAGVTVPQSSKFISGASIMVYLNGLNSMSCLTRIAMSLRESFLQSFLLPWQKALFICLSRQLSLVPVNRFVVMIYKKGFTGKCKTYATQETCSSVSTLTVLCCPCFFFSLSCCSSFLHEFRLLLIVCIPNRNILYRLPANTKIFYHIFAIL